jgi:hypothetical protein
MPTARPSTPRSSAARPRVREHALSCAATSSRTRRAPDRPACASSAAARRATAAYDAFPRLASCSRGRTMIAAYSTAD